MRREDVVLSVCGAFGRAALRVIPAGGLSESEGDDIKTPSNYDKGLHIVACTDCISVLRFRLTGEMALEPHLGTFGGCHLGIECRACRLVITALFLSAYCTRSVSFS